MDLNQTSNQPAASPAIQARSSFVKRCLRQPCISLVYVRGLCVAKMAVLWSFAHREGLTLLGVKGKKKYLRKYQFRGSLAALARLQIILVDIPNPDINDYICHPSIIHRLARFADTAHSCPADRSSCPHCTPSISMRDNPIHSNFSTTTFALSK